MAHGYRILDVHHHVGDATAILGGASEVPSGVMEEETLRAEMAARLAIMDRDGVEQAVVIPGHSYLRPHGIADTRRVNDAIAAYRDRRPDRFPVALGIVEPRDGPAALAEIDRARAELRLAGISFHVRFQGVSLDNLWVRRYLERMADRGLVPVIHAIPESPDEALWKVAKLARALPDVPILALDAFAAHESARECSLIAEIAPNILFDISLAHSFEVIEAFARQFGAARVVFGTDLYSPPLGKRISHLLPQILESGLSEAEKAAIFGGNARRLFGLPELGG
jgi:predicted TIM-barrel fold metal-dependent hydrolase